MSVEGTRETMTRYLDSGHTDTSTLADDVVFTTMATGEVQRGRDAVAQMLHHFYHGAFDAKLDTTNVIFGDGKATLEGQVRGKHIGEFAGIPATQKEIDVPLCVVYDLKDDLIQQARVYLEIPVLLRQLGVAP